MKDIYLVDVKASEGGSNFDEFKSEGLCMKHGVVTLLEDSENQGNLCRGNRLEDLPDPDF